jgi:hypothetical protein
MQAMLVLAILGIFLLGLIYALILIGRLLTWLLGPSDSPTSLAPPARAARPTPPPHPTAQAATPERRHVLDYVWNEIIRAFYAGRIKRETYHDMREYVTRERTQLDARFVTPPVMETPPVVVQTRQLSEVAVKAATEVAERPALATPTPPPQPPKPVIEAQPVRRPEQIRASIAKLHAHAQALTPIEPAVAAAEIAAVVRAPAEPEAALRPTPPPAAPSPPPAPPAPPKKPLAERLFTPENVRILQSLGICLIFISAAAFVRTQMWADASAWTRIAIVLAGTAACTGLGYALRRWTSLRITALGFLILGQLSLILDAYAAVIGPDGSGVYPYCPSSLWTIAFVAFSGLAVWQARTLKEPLFDTFAFFGGLAAWGSAAIWCDIDPWLVPAAFVPAAFISALLARWLRAGAASEGTGASNAAGEGPVAPLRRWSQAWWLECGWTIGAFALAAAVPGAALLARWLVGSEHLVTHYGTHAAAMIALALGLLVRNWSRSRPASGHTAAALLLFVAPLGAFAFTWHWADWAAAFALPGAALVVGSLLVTRFGGSRHEASITPLAYWGLGAVLAGFSGAVAARCWGAEPGPLAWSAGATLVAALAFGLLRSSVWAPWLATLAGSFLAALCCDMSGFTSHAWPTVWFVLALAAHGVWTWFSATPHLSRHGRAAADLLALVAAAALVLRASLFPGLFTLNLCFDADAGCVAAAAYVLLTSLWEARPWRRALGFALLGPALVGGLHLASWLTWSSLIETATTPLVLSGLIVAATVAASLLDRREKNAALFHSALAGIASIVAYGAVFAVREWNACGLPHQYASVALSFSALALAAGVLITRLRVYWSRLAADCVPEETARTILAVGEAVALALLAISGVCVAQRMDLVQPLWPLALAGIAALVVAVGMAAEHVAFFCERRTAERPFRTAADLVGLLLGAAALLALWHVPGVLTSAADALPAAWAPALVLLFLALRHRLMPGARSTLGPDDARALLAAPAFVLAGLFAVTACAQTVAAQFWNPAAAGDDRAACALFFAMLLGVSVLAALGLRSSFGSITGMLGLFGLAGCAYGACGLPPESFGICCALLGVLAAQLASAASKSQRFAGSAVPLTLRLAGIGVVGFGIVHMLWVLVGWPTGSGQTYAMAGWLLLSALAGVEASRPPRHGMLAAAATLAAGLAVCHAHRWAGVPFEQFGPGLAGAALVMLAVREIVARLTAPRLQGGTSGPLVRWDFTPFEGVAGGVLCGAVITAIAGLACCGWGSASLALCRGVTLAESALFVAALAIALRREGWSGSLLAWLELGTWSLVACAGWQFSTHLLLPWRSAPMTATLLGAGIVLLALSAERVTAFGMQTAGRRLDGARPFHVTGGVVAVALAAIAFVFLWGQSTLAVANSVRNASHWLGTPDFIIAAWTAALVPLFVALRTRLPGAPDSEQHRDGSQAALTACGWLVAALLTSTAALRALHTQFWLPATPADERAACALFFGVVAAISVLCTVWLKRGFGPVTGMLAAMGLAGCAYGAWKLPPESFGLCCALLAWLAGSLDSYVRRVDEWRATAVPTGMRVAAAGAALYSAACMLVGLAASPVGQSHSYAVAGWLLLASLFWTAAQGRAAGFVSLAATLSVAGAACHALRWAGLPFSHFGPGLGAAALALVAARHVAASIAALRETDSDEETDAKPAAPPLFVKQGRGILAGIGLTACASLAFGVWGCVSGEQWRWCVTLLEQALLLAALSVVLRREGAVSHRCSFALELGFWFFLTLTVGAATGERALNMPLSGAAWVLMAALFLLLGMAGESVAGPLVAASNVAPPQKRNLADCATARYVPFLGSRYAAATTLMLYGVARACLAHDAFSKTGLALTWPAILGAGALAVYGSFAQWSLNETRRDLARKVASLAAYLVFLPAGYMCFLSAHSTGSSWGALYFIALAPMLLAAAYVLEKEKLAAQSLHALLGVALVSAGALVLAFAGNREHLAGVPCLTLSAIGAELLLLRRWQPCGIVDRSAPWSPTLAACLTFVGATYFGALALGGWPAWGAESPWAWQMPMMAVFGLAMAILGGALDLEVLPGGASRSPRSLVALCGFWTVTGALALAATQCVFYGREAAYLVEANMARLDALIAALVLFAGAGLAAERWLKLACARHASALAMLAGYALLVWRLHAPAWEWYCAPMAAFLFAWAWQVWRETQAPDMPADAVQSKEREVTALTILASLLAVMPSFLQALPCTPEGMWHYGALVVLSLPVLLGALATRRKAPLLIAGVTLIAGTLIKSLQWAHRLEVLMPVVGIATGLLVLGIGVLFESRMNVAFRKAVDKAKAEARMFWVSWE